MVIHVVQPGETVFGIARQYGISAQRIITDNGIIARSSLVVGQSLVIQFPAVVYTVLPGDTLTGIARSYGVSLLTLLQNNPDLIVNRDLRVGQQITIRFSGEKEGTAYFNGYAYPYINRSTLLRELPYLSTLTIFGYGFTEGGQLIPIDDTPLIELALQYNVAPVMLLSSITEQGTFSGARASRLFADISFQNFVLEQILAVMQDKGYYGLDIDFEYIQPEDSQNFINFVQNAVERLRPYDYFVNVDLAPKISAEQQGLLYESHKYAELGAAADTVLLMTYEWGYTYGPPMAVAPLNKVREVVEYALTEIPREKIMLGIPNYGYDWALPFQRGLTRATSIGNQYAVEIAARNNARIEFDISAQSPYFYYTVPPSQEHIVWFEDARSINGKFNLISDYGLRGGGYWNLMRPFTQNWTLLNAVFDVNRIVNR